MILDRERLEKYLDEVAAETIDIENTIGQKGKKKLGFVHDPHVLKSLKYSTIVIAEAIASTLQHILAKNTTFAAFPQARHYSLVTVDSSPVTFYLI